MDCKIKSEFDKTEYAVEIRNLTYAYNGNLALKDVSMSIKSGEFIAVMGPNGSGKTTLLRAIAGIIRPVKGEVFVNGTVGYMPQKEHISPTVPIKAIDVVLMGRLAMKKKISIISKPSKDDLKVAEDALKAVGMLEFAKKSFTELSGGQQQRVLLARALAVNPNVLLLDEPFNGVDLPTQEKIINLLDELSSKGVTVIVVVHNVSPLIHHVNRIALLNRELVAFGSPEDVLTPENTAKAYGTVIPVTVCEEGFLHPLFGDIHG